jgi:hypothetical protein
MHGRQQGDDVDLVLGDPFARPVCEIPNHSGGCGCWTGRSTMGTAS